MSLAAWALLVASLSAAGTVANMIASWATFKRRRPRVEVGYQSWTRIDPETGREHLALDVTIVNHGENSVTLQPIGTFRVATKKRSGARSYWNYQTWRYIRDLQKQGLPVKWEWRGAERQIMAGPLEIIGDAELEVAPFNGVRWQAKSLVPNLAEGGDYVFRIGVVLSTGKVVHSPPMPFRRYLVLMIFGTEEAAMPGQLSILDLCQAEEATGEN